MDKRILLATDGSQYSEGAVRETINLARNCGGRICAMSVIETNLESIAEGCLGTRPLLSDLEKMEKERREYLEGIRDRAAKEDVACEIIIREGEGPDKFIIEEADKRQAGLIVMGRRGRTGLARLLMGSATAGVIAHTSCPVLVVPRASSIKWKNIVIATDGSKYSEAAAGEALNLMKRCDGTGALNAVAVVRKSATKERTQILEKALKEIKQEAEKEEIKVDTLLVKDKPHESIHESIIKYAQEKEADIIVMGSYGRTGIKRLLMGSVAEKVIGHTDRAVLVVKNVNKKKVIG